MKKKLLATLMIVAMSASMLAGCGSKADAPADNAAATDDTAKDDAAATDDDATADTEYWRNRPTDSIATAHFAGST